MMIPDGQEYAVHHGDCIPHMADMPAASVDCSIFSPPFPAVFSYSSLLEDIGNSEARPEFKLHLGFFFRQLRRVIKPGRVMICHCTQVVHIKRSGEEGVYDFRGLLIRLAIRAGFIYEYDWVIRKPPQQQAVRTKKHELLFVGLERDRARSRGAMPDYLLKFRVPGENAVPIDSKGDVSRNEWIAWAECCWDDIRGNDTLNVSEGRGEDDVRHICPLQLSVINRLVRLYSNPDEIVFSPFAGIGSEGHQALNLGRRFYGCEIKNEYYHACLKNLERAVNARSESTRTLFDALAD